MRKYFLAALILLALTTGLAVANPSHASQKKMYKAYKGEDSYFPPLPAAPQQAAHFSFGGGPYLGFNLGLRTNYTSNPVAYKGLEGIVTGGFGVLLKNGFYIAEEIFVEDGVQLQNYSDSAESSKSSWSAGLSILPGYLILDNLIGYLRLGVVRTHFSSDGSANGGQVGLGFESALSENWDLRGEYIYSFYETTFGCSTQPGELGSVKADQFNLGLIYKFM
ncbi:MAG TPA: outer membrane beta-barrel protein [Gammaproteobacteria bacterium]|nr:outer membrane beta-barrel protein [Gammaproteobacteria bacterium]